MERLNANVLMVCTALLGCLICGAAAAADPQAYADDGYVVMGSNLPEGYGRPLYGYPGITYGGPVDYAQYEQIGVWSGNMTGCNGTCTGLWNDYCNEPHYCCKESHFFCRVKSRCRPLGCGPGPACPSACRCGTAPRQRTFGGFWDRCRRTICGAPASCGCSNSSKARGAVNGSGEQLPGPATKQPLPPDPVPDSAT